MASLSPYLHFNGNAEEAFNFYKSVFGGEFATFTRYKDVPEGVPSPGASDAVMHVSLPISKETVLMGSDMPPKFPAAVMGTNFAISVNAESEKDADNLFKGLSAGGKVFMPMDKTFWGAYFGMFTDRFGIQWMINYDYNRNK
jgi:PhnB protein